MAETKIPFILENNVPSNSPYNQELQEQLRTSFKELTPINYSSSNESDADIPEDLLSMKENLENSVNKMKYELDNYIGLRDRAEYLKDKEKFAFYNQKVYESINYNSQLVNQLFLLNEYISDNKNKFAAQSLLSGLSEEEQGELMQLTNKRIIATKIRNLTDRYLQTEKENQKKNIEVAVGQPLITDTIMPGLNIVIPKFDILVSGKDAENAIYDYIEETFYKQIRDNESAINYYKEKNSEELENDIARYQKEFREYLSGQRKEKPVEIDFGKNPYQDILGSIIRGKSNLKSEDAYYNAVYNTYYSEMIPKADAKDYAEKMIANKTYLPGALVQVIGDDGEITTDIEHHYKVGREDYYKVAQAAEKKSSQIFLSRAFDRLEYKVLTSEKEKEMDRAILKQGVDKNVYTKIKTEFLNGTADPLKYNDTEHDVLSKIEDHLTKNDLLTRAEVKKFKKNVVEGGEWYGALYLDETNLVQRFGFKLTNRRDSDSEIDPKINVRRDNGEIVTFKLNTRNAEETYLSEERAEFERIYNIAQKFKEEELREKEIATSRELNENAKEFRDFFANKEYQEIVKVWEVIKSNSEDQSYKEKLYQKGSFQPGLLDHFMSEGASEVDLNKEITKLLSIDLETNPKLTFDVLGQEWTREQVKVLQKYETLSIAKENLEKAEELLKEIREGGFWNNLGEGFLKAMGSIKTTSTSLAVGSDIQYLDKNIFLEKAMAEKYKGSILAGNYNDVLRLQTDKEDPSEVIAKAEQIMDNSEFMYLKSKQIKNEALTDFSANAGLFTRIGESVGTSLWFMAEMAITWPIYGAIGKGLTSLAMWGARGLTAGAEALAARAVASSIAGSVFRTEAALAGRVLLKGASYIPRYFGPALEIGKLSSIAQFPARLVQNTIANVSLSLISPSTINFVLDDMNSKGMIHYVEVNGQTVPVGHADVAAFLYNANELNNDYFKNNILNNDDKLLAYYGISGDVKDKTNILKNLRDSYTANYLEKQKELAFIRDKKGPQIYSSIVQGVYEQFLERFTETSIGTVLDIALAKTFGKATGYLEKLLKGKNITTKIATETEPIAKNVVAQFLQNITRIGAYTGGNAIRRNAYIGMKFINNYIFGRATVNGFINSPISEIGEEVFRQLLPTKVFNVPDGKTILSSYAEDVQQLSSGKWWEEVSASVLLTTATMGGVANLRRGIMESGYDYTKKDKKEIQAIEKRREQLISDNKGLTKKQLKVKLNEFDAKNPRFNKVLKTEGSKRRLMEDLVFDINYATDEEMLAKWASANTFGVFVGRADIDELKNWLVKSQEAIGGLESNGVLSEELLMKKMINNISYAFGARGENTVEALEALKRRYSTFIGNKNGKNDQLYDIINEQIDVVKNFDSKIKLIKTELKGEDPKVINYMIQKIITQFHKTRHASVELDIFKVAIESMFSRTEDTEKKNKILKTLDSINKISNFLFDDKFSLEINDKIKDDIIKNFRTLSRDIEALKTIATPEEAMLLDAAYALNRGYKNQFASYFVSYSMINDLRNNYYKKAILDLANRGYDSAYIRKILKGKLSKENESFISLLDERKNNQSTKINPVDAIDGQILAEVVEGNKIKVWMVQEVEVNGKKEKRLIDVNGRVISANANSGRFWTATEEEAKYYVKPENTKGKDELIDNKAARETFNELELSKEVMKDRKTALLFFKKWLENEKKNLKGNDEALAKLNSYATLAETKIKEYFSNKKDRASMDLSDYGFDAKSGKATIQKKAITAEDASQLNDNLKKYLFDLYGVELKTISDFRNYILNNIAKFFDKKNLEAQKSIVDKKSYENYLINITNDYINNLLEYRWSYGFALNELEAKYKDQDTTNPIEITEAYIWYNGEVIPKEEFDRTVYDEIHGIESETGLSVNRTRKSKADSKVKEQKTKKEKVLEEKEKSVQEETKEEVKPEESTSEQSKEKEQPDVKEIETGETQEETEETQEETEEIQEEPKETIEELANDNDIIIPQEEIDLSNLDIDDLNDDFGSFIEAKFSHLRELKREFERLDKKYKAAILRIARNFELMHIATWDDAVQYLFNKGILQSDVSLQKIEMFRYAAYLADINVTLSEINQWFHTATTTGFSKQINDKFKIKSYNILEEDIEDIVQWEKNDQLFHLSLNRQTKDLSASPFDVVTRKGKEFIDKDGNHVEDENKMIVPFDDENVTSNIFIRVPVHWTEEGVATDYLYVELPRQNLRKGFIDITAVYKLVHKRNSLSDKQKRAAMISFVKQNGFEFGEEFEQAIKNLDFKRDDLKNYSRNKRVVFEKGKGIEVLDEKDLSIYDIQLPYRIKSYTKNGVTVKTLDGIMATERLATRGMTIADLQEEQSILTETLNLVQQQKRKSLGEMMNEIKREIVSNIIQNELKKIKNRNISLGIMLVNLEQYVNDYIEKEFSGFTKEERIVLKDQMLGLKPGTYVGSVAEELGIALSLTESSVVSFLENIKYKKEYYNTDKIKEKREEILLKKESDRTQDEIEWLENNLESDDLTVPEIESLLFGMADNQLSCEQKLSRIVSLALYGIKYVESDGTVSYLSVGTAIQTFVNFYELGSEGYNLSFDDVHKKVMKLLKEANQNTNAIESISALFERIKDLKDNYEIGESIINELYGKMDVEKISFLALQNQLDKRGDILRGKIIEVGGKTAMATLESRMLAGAIKSKLIEIEENEQNLITEYSYNEENKNKAIEYLNNIVNASDVELQRIDLESLLNLIGLKIGSNTIDFLLKDSENIDIKDFCKEGGLFYELLNLDKKFMNMYSFWSVLTLGNSDQYESLERAIENTVIHEQQSFWDKGKLYYNLKNKSHTDDINSFLKFGDDIKVREFLAEKHSMISELLLLNKELRKKLHTKRLSNSLLINPGEQYSQGYTQIPDETKKLFMLKLFLDSKRIMNTDKRQTNGLSVISFYATGSTQSDYDIFDVNNTLGFDFTQHIYYQKGEILISDDAINFIALSLFKEDVYRIKKFSMNRQNNMKEMSDVGKLFMNIPELNSHILDDNETFNSKALNVNESKIDDLFNQYKNLITNYVKSSLINQMYSMIDVQDKKLVVKNYDKFDEGYIQNFSTNDQIVQLIGDFIINQSISYNNSLSLYFDDINDVEVKANSIFAGGNINKRMFDQEEYDSYNDPRISEFAKLMHEEKDPEKQENYWDQLQKMLPLYKTKLNPDGTFMFEQNAINYINNAVKEITNRARKLRSPSTRIFKGQKDAFFDKETYSALQLNSYQTTSAVLYDYMKLSNIGNERERKAIEDAIKTNTFSDDVKDIINRYQDETGFKQYSSMTEADGQEYESWRFRLQVLLSSGEITRKQFKELKSAIETQFHELKKDGKVTTVLPDWAVDLFNVNKPLQVANVQGRGIYIKSASIPLIPSLISKSEYLTMLALKLNEFEENNETIARLSFETAIKQGQVLGENSITTEKVMDSTPFELKNAINNIPLYAYGIQVENPQSNLKDSENNLATQVSKMMTSGVVINTTSKDFSIHGENYNGQELNKLYTDVMVELTNRKLELFLKSFGIVRNIETGEYTIKAEGTFYERINSKITASLRYDNFKIDFNYNYRDNSYKGDGERIIQSKVKLDESKYSLVSLSFDTDLWQQDTKGAIENVLMSEIRKHSTKHKVAGNKLKVVSSNGFDGLVQGELTREDVLKENEVLLTDDYDGRLGAHINNKGITEHHVLIKRDIVVEVEGELKEIDLADYVENGKLVLPESFKTRCSWRVPLSGIQSSSIIKVVGFLPKYNGNTLVTSTESAIQLGEDFDFDTRFTYSTIFNDNVRYEEDKDGNLIPTEIYSGDYDTYFYKDKYNELTLNGKIIALNNALIDIYKSVLFSKNTEVRKVATTPINFTRMVNTAELLKKNKKQTRYTSYLNIEDQINQMNNGAIGKLGVALASLTNTTQSLFGMAQPNYEIKFTIPVSYRATSRFQNENKQYQRIIFGDIIVDGSVPLNNKTRNGTRYISEQASEIQNTFVDNRKLSIMLELGIDEDTINQYLIMSLIYGVDSEEGKYSKYDYCAIFMQLPIIKEYSKSFKFHKNKLGMSKDIYEILDSEMEKKYLSEETIEKFNADEGSWLAEKAFREKYSKSLTIEQMLDLSAKDFEDLTQEEKNILFSAYMNFKLLSYQVSNIKDLNGIFGFEKNLVGKTYSSMENSTNRIIKILKGEDPINKSIENLDKLFGEMISREDLIGEELEIYSRLKKEYQEAVENESPDVEDKKSLYLDQKNEIQEILNKHVYLGKVDEKHQYLKPSNPITLRILSVRAYTNLFKKELLYKQDEYLSLSRRIDGFLNSHKFRTYQYERYDDALHRFVLGISYNKVVDSLIEDDYTLFNGTKVTKNFFDKLLNGELYHLLINFTANNESFANNKLIRELKMSILNGQTNLKITFNGNKKDLQEAAIKLMNNVQFLTNDSNESTIKYKNKAYSPRDIISLISLYALKTNNSSLISLIPSDFKESIKFNDRLSKNKIENQEDLNNVLSILKYNNLKVGRYIFDARYTDFLSSRLTRLGVKFKIDKNQLTISKVPEETAKNYTLLFILQNTSFVRTIDKETHENLKQFLTEERLKSMFKDGEITFTRNQIRETLAWVDLKDVTNNDGRNLQYFKFNIPLDKKSDVIILGYINPQKETVTFYPAQREIKLMELPKNRKALEPGKITPLSTIVNDEVNQNKFEQIVKYIRDFNTNENTMYITSSGLTTIKLAHEYLSGSDNIPSWFHESGGLTSLYFTSHKSAPLMAGIILEDTIKYIQSNKIKDVEGIRNAVNKFFTANQFLGFDENGNPIEIKTAYGNTRRTGIHKGLYEKSKKLINKLTSPENKELVASMIFTYLERNKHYKPFDDENNNYTTAILLNTRYGNVVLKSIPDQVYEETDKVNIIDIKFLQHRFSDVSEVAPYVLNHYLQHLTYQYSLAEQTGKNTSFKYGVFTNLGYVEVVAEPLTQANKNKFFNEIEYYVKQSLELFNMIDETPIKKRYAEALKYNGKENINEGTHKKIVYAQDVQFSSLEEVPFNEDGTLGKFSIIDKILTSQRESINEIANADMEIFDKERLFNKYVKNRSTPFTKILKGTFKNARVILTNKPTIYNTETNTIYLNRLDLSAETIIEESIHAATFPYVDKYLRASIDFDRFEIKYKIKKGAPQEIEDILHLYIDAFDIFISKAKANLNSEDFTNLILDIKHKSFGKRFMGDEVIYGYDISNIYEFMASLWKANESAKFLEIKDVRNIFEKLWDLILKLFGRINNITTEKEMKQTVTRIVNNFFDKYGGNWESEYSSNVIVTNNIEVENVQLKC